MARTIIDLTGLRFGSLLVVGYPAISIKTRGATWWCACDCGEQKRIAKSSLTSGRSRSCGCKVVEAGKKNATHGQSKTPMYARWRAMISRCSNPNLKGYHCYGGRGIKVCERWKVFENFVADMGECPAGWSLDRIDNDGDYEPSNCRWATVAVQTRNTRQNCRLVIDGRDQVVADWVKESGTPFTTIHNRLKRGVPPREAVFS